jgi:hypothetical protein
VTRLRRELAAALAQNTALALGVLALAALVPVPAVTVDLGGGTCAAQVDGTWALTDCGWSR